MKTVSENATGGSVNGMGAISLPNTGEIGSGDVIVSTKNKKKRKKMRKFSDVYIDLEEKKDNYIKLIDHENELANKVYTSIQAMYNVSGSRGSMISDEVEDIKFDPETLDIDESSLKVIAKLLNTNTRDLSTEISEILNDSDLLESFKLTSEQSDTIIDLLLSEDMINESDVSALKEGIFGSIIGGLGGLAFGKSIGKLLANTLGIKEKSPLYNVLTSRLVGTAIGAALGKKLAI